MGRLKDLLDLLVEDDFITTAKADPSDADTYDYDWSVQPTGGGCEALYFDLPNGQFVAICSGMFEADFEIGLYRDQSDYQHGEVALVPMFCTNWIYDAVGYLERAR
jgi:hypothetical protein